MNEIVQFFKELFSPSALILFACTVPGALLALTVHGRALAKRAAKGVRPEEAVRARLTWNPLRQLSVWGTVLFLLTGYGWSKPLKEGRDRLPAGAMLAGVWANFLWGLILMGVNTVVLFVDVEINLNTAAEMVAFFDVIEMIVELAAMANFTLAVFSLLPWPGSGGYFFLKKLCLGKGSNRTLDFLERYGLWIVLVIVVGDWVLDFFWSAGFLKYGINLPVSFLYNLLVTVQEAILNFVTNDGYAAYMSWAA